jgi:hypothetical protein
MTLIFNFKKTIGLNLTILTKVMADDHQFS